MTSERPMLSDLPEETRALMGVIDQAADTLKMLSHPSRLLICCQLRFGEMSVGDMEHRLAIKQPNLSRELGKLRDGGFVTTRRQSKLVFYRLAEPGITQLLDAICLIFLQNTKRHEDFLGDNGEQQSQDMLRNLEPVMPSLAAGTTPDINRDNR